ncbi:MAG TPA: hypothetical protein VMY78_12750 [Solirubrobacteraceae bacterium]|nr:hypothetical protein [Solirubrobacteraceae bacterium]
MGLLTDLVVRPAARAGAAAQNALEVARFGGLETGEEAAPYEVAVHERNYRLRRYFPPVDGDGDGADAGPPILLVPPMMLAADVYDVTPSSSGARVLEFYGSAEGEAVLVNLSGAKPGCEGRPLPGSPEVRVAGYDVQTGRLLKGTDGFAFEAPRGEVGMLLARERRGVVSTSESPLRGVFERGDAWLSTGDLFRADADGDLWLVDDVRSLVLTARGPVPTLPIQEALGDLDAVDLAVAFGVRSEHGDEERAVCAVTLRARAKLTAADVERALAPIAAGERPDVVAVVREIPLTTWYRPLAAPLRARGLPRAGKRAWVRSGERYVQLTKERRAKL